MSVLARWNGETLEPLRRYTHECNRDFVVGEVYEVEVVEPRRANYERAYFAQLKDAFVNLPEAYEGRWANPDEFRKYLLVKTGWCTEKRFVLPSAKIAQQVLAAFLGGDDTSIYELTGNVITKWTPRSQKRSAMNKQDFEQSSRAVLDAAAEIIGVESDQLRQHGGKAA